MRSAKGDDDVDDYNGGDNNKGDENNADDDADNSDDDNDTHSYDDNDEDEDGDGSRSGDGGSLTLECIRSCLERIKTLARTVRTTCLQLVASRSQDLHRFGSGSERFDGCDPIVTVVQFHEAVLHRVVRLTPTPHDDTAQGAFLSRSGPKPPHVLLFVIEEYRRSSQQASHLALIAAGPHTVRSHPAFAVDVHVSTLSMTIIGEDETVELGDHRPVRHVLEEGPLSVFSAKRTEVRDYRRIMIKLDTNCARFAVAKGVHHMVVVE